MLAELNEAHSILRNPKSRKEYDLSRSNITQQQAESSPPPRQETPPTFELGELTPGYANFDSLPKNIQDRMLKRQSEQKGGYEYLFGPETHYSKADKKFTFEIFGDQISGYTITLYQVRDGNLSTSTIKPTDF